MAAIGLIPALILLLLVIGSNAIGLVFGALFNLSASIGIGSYVYGTSTLEYEIPQENP